ncbi:hypothetical protein [Streptomyces sp. NPDC058371]|uniref:hypothetical protein n=1 Tax=Streptomyces sp. NPDC058371 TaxID=3346463 RepID=UPI003663DD2D
MAVATVALRAGAVLTDAPGSAYSMAFVVMGAVCLLATVGALRLHPAAGDVVRGVVAGQDGVTQVAVSDSRKSE